MTLLLLMLVALLAVLPACREETAATDEAVLTVTDGTIETAYTVEDLQRLRTTEVEADGTVYVGVPLSAVLQDAGFDPAAIGEVTAVAADDFSATYTPEQMARPDTLVAYATQGGELGTDEQPFRMVLPDEAGRLNVRMLSRIEVAQ